MSHFRCLFMYIKNISFGLIISAPLCLSYITIYPNLQNTLSFGDHPFIGAISASDEKFFEVCQQVISAGGQIQRIRWMWKQFELKFMQFCYHGDRVVTRYVILVKEFFFLLNLEPFYHDFFRQTYQ